MSSSTRRAGRPWLRSASGGDGQWQDRGPTVQRVVMVWAERQSDLEPPDPGRDGVAKLRRDAVRANQQRDAHCLPGSTGNTTSGRSCGPDDPPITSPVVGSTTSAVT